jgi:hypothetical protein
MLSGNARSPGTAIDNGPACAAVIQRTDANSAPANAACLERDTGGGQELAIDMLIPTLAAT